jgi:ABC-type uncharacterized transport system ATPase subunit
MRALSAMRLTRAVEAPLRPEGTVVVTAHADSPRDTLAVRVLMVEQHHSTKYRYVVCDQIIIACAQEETRDHKDEVQEASFSMGCPKANLPENMQV